jgi:DNA mismatch repair protein MutS2
MGYLMKSFQIDLVASINSAQRKNQEMNNKQNKSDLKLANSENIVDLSSDQINHSKLVLDYIPGIGKKIKSKLLEYYSSEADAIDAIKRGLIGCVPGISFKQALRFANTCFEITHNLTIDDVLKTPDIKEIFQGIIELIANYSNTEYSKLKLQLFFPLPSSNLQLIKDRQELFSKALHFTSHFQKELEKKKFSQYLHKLGQFKQVDEFLKIKSRIIIYDKDSTDVFLKNEGIVPSLNHERIDFRSIKDPQAFFENYCKIFDVVLYCGNSKNLPVFPNLISITPENFSVERLFPEKIVQMFAINKKLIQAMINIVVILKSLKNTDSIQDFLKKFDLSQLKILKNNTSILDGNGEILEKIDPKLDKYRFIDREYPSFVADIENIINEDIKDEVGKRSIQIQGRQILDLFRSDLTLEMVRDYIPPEVDDLIMEKIHKGLDELGNHLQLERNDKDLLLNLIPEIMEFPIQMNEHGIDVLQKLVSSRMNTYKYYVMVDIAMQLKTTYEYLLKLRQTLLDFDFFYTVGSFAQDFGLTIPKLQKNYGFFGEHLTNLHLQQACKSNKTLSSVPITYQLGKILPGGKNSKSIPGLTPASLNLLTGSNSGGKTMCMLTCVQALCLAQMGFPSIGNFSFHPFDELYFFKKSTGQISAGAFETTLLQFVNLAQSTKLKIVFADELESITEPSAASKVLAGIFSLLLENPKNYGIFVTHLVEMLLKDIDIDHQKHIRVDGIEATGLDKNLQLIVDRNPRYNFVAKSTPELILTRLSKIGSDGQKKFFTSILNKF